MRRFRLLVLGIGALVAASVAAAPVGAHEFPASDRRPGTAMQQVDLVALASIGFSQDVYTVARPGKVRITVSGVPGMAITLRERLRVHLYTRGGPNRALVTLRKGTYHVESMIPGHTAAGIHTLLVVG